MNRQHMNILLTTIMGQFSQVRAAPVPGISGTKWRVDCANKQRMAGLSRVYMSGGGVLPKVMQFMFFRHASCFEGFRKGVLWKCWQVPFSFFRVFVSCFEVVQNFCFRLVRMKMLLLICLLSFLARTNTTCTSRVKFPTMADLTNTPGKPLQFMLFAQCCSYLM